MNDSSAFQAPAEPATPRAERVLVWDAPVRAFHWLMVIAFAGAWLSAESERWRLMHVAFGYTMLALVAFRVVWGLAGTRHARSRRSCARRRPWAAIC
jgi:cytochrome b